MKKLILIDCDGVVLNWDDTFEWWVQKKYGIVKDNVSEYSGGVYGRYQLSFTERTKLKWLDLVSEFNSTEDCANLPPLRDSIRQIRYLHEEHGYVFRAITSFGLDPRQQRNRIENLRRYFGSAIVGVDFADICGDKKHLLTPYEGTGIPWVEDKLSNCLQGVELGLQGYLMMHQYNYKDALDMDSRILPIANWKDLCYNLCK